MSDQWWAVQRKGRWGRNRRWKTLAVCRTRDEARWYRGYDKRNVAGDGFVYRVRKATIEVAT